MTPQPARADVPAPAGGCPVHAVRISDRKTGRTADAPPAPYWVDEAGLWHVADFRLARAILRHGDVRQAGFQAEFVDKMPVNMKQPVLYQEGAEHHEQRRQTARFFTPKTTDENYRALMERLADEIVAGFIRRGTADLSELSMALAVAVAAEVVGLTDSLWRGMDRRIDDFLDQSDIEFGWRPRQLASMVSNQWKMLRFYLVDVRPAIRARRRAPREDVISHLLASDYRDMEILTECVTYGAAGMITTREFISVAVWHFLDSPDLRARYVVAPEPERVAMLHEILRLEPVVSCLHRRATADLALEHDGGTVTIPAGSLIELDIQETNVDESAVGAEPLCLRPGRAMHHRAQPYVMSFGDGHHRCPGAFIAIQESDIFLRRFLALEGLRVERGPELSWNETVQGYELRRFIVSLA